jgi:deoxycytidylate deaminase
MALSQHSKDAELVLGIVAPVGVNLDDVNNRLESLFAQFQYKVNLLHLSRLASGYASSPSYQSELERLDQGMNIGRRLREKFSRGDFYALLAINAINALRPVNGNGPEPLQKTVHVIRSLKHPDEVETLRRAYGDGFFLVAVSSSVQSRREYLKNLKGIPDEHLDRLIARDDKESEYGQRTQDVFQLADAFVATDDTIELSKQLSRILDLLFANPTVSPTADEYAMFLAYAASLRSADLSRQVGAVIANQHSDIIATGANDVPRAGGGLYWPTENDQRDYKRGFDSNEIEKQSILLKVMKKLHPEGSSTDAELIANGMSLFKDTGLLNITEYGRAVHAEMEAIISAARNGISVRDGILYSTTYPCHNCAKHIVTAGIAKVKYIEPYPKSYATKLHGDSIDSDGIDADDKVGFEHFVGIGPRRFVDLFSMTLSSGRNLTRKQNGHLIEWNRGQAQLRVPMAPYSYLDAELALLNELAIISAEPDGGAEDGN